MNIIETESLNSENFATKVVVAQDIQVSGGLHVRRDRAQRLLNVFAAGTRALQPSIYSRYSDSLRMHVLHTALLVSTATRNGREPSSGTQNV